MTIDTHVHFWREDSIQTQWMDLAPYKDDIRYDVLRNDFVPQQLHQHLKRHGVDGALIIQAIDDEEENIEILSIADRYDFILGVVGWIPLGDVAQTIKFINAYGQHEKFVGTRHLINTELDPEWILHPSRIESLTEIAKAGLTFDYVGILDAHLDSLMCLGTLLPELNIVLDHLNHPKIDNKEWEPWASLLQSVAKFPNFSAKISGLDNCANWVDWTLNDIRPFLDHALKCFGADRLMFGSNWPVTNLSGGYEKYYNTIMSWLHTLSEADSHLILHKNAQRIYGLSAS